MQDLKSSPNDAKARFRSIFLIVNFAALPDIVDPVLLAYEECRVQIQSYSKTYFGFTVAKFGFNRALNQNCV